MVDLTAFGRWIWEHAPPAPGQRVESTPAFCRLLEAVRASPRRVLFVAAQEPIVTPIFDRQKLADLTAAVRAAMSPGDILESDLPLNGLLARIFLQGIPVAVISVDLKTHLARLFVLDCFDVKVVLDALDGRAWTRASVSGLLWETTSPGGFIEPVVLPRVEALTLPPPGGRYAIGTAVAARYRVQIASLLSALSPIEGVTNEFPQSISAAAVKNRSDWAQRAAELEGNTDDDPVARASLIAWLRNAHAQDELHGMTQYIVPNVERSADGELLLHGLHVVKDGHPVVLFGDAARAHLEALLGHDGERWVIPRALGLMGWMVDQGLQLPRRAFDPALTAFFLCSDSPKTIHDRILGTRDLSSVATAALWDCHQDTRLTEHEQILLALPTIERELLSIAASRKMGRLVEDDIAATVPALASIERRGATVACPFGFASWTTFLTSLEAETDSHEQIVREVLGREDLYRLSPRFLSKRLGAWIGLLPKEVWLPRLSPDDVLRRQARHHRAASAALEARRLQGKLRRWAGRLNGHRRLRGRHVPARTGRFTFRDSPLHGLVKRGSSARGLRSALVAPPLRAGADYELVSLDYSAFELRILAWLCKDQALLDAVRDPLTGLPRDDPFKWIRKQLARQGIRVSRATVKQAMHAMDYGSGRAGIAAALDQLEISEAERLFDALQKMFPGREAYRKKILQQLKANGYVSTPSGARREPRGASKGRRAAERAAFNFIVQGRAADILRFVLRRLHEVLPPFGAFVVHQLHDEVYVAVPRGKSKQVIPILKRVMLREVEREPGLLPRGARLAIGRIRIGSTWADLL
ncbi:MAG TPA: DNA polymerase [Lacunisphaera sp.]|nr:DNA polymerase [Lacunisphaera sp.]